MSDDDMVINIGTSAPPKPRRPTPQQQKPKAHGNIGAGAGGSARSGQSRPSSSAPRARPSGASGGSYQKRPHDERVEGANRDDQDNERHQRVEGKPKGDGSKGGDVKLDANGKPMFKRRIGKVEKVKKIAVEGAVPRGLARHERTSTSAADTFTGKPFSELDLSVPLLETINGPLNLQVMTHVQGLTIPAMMRGSDILMKARTGTGKTYSFLIPVINSLGSRPSRIERTTGTRAMLIAPTRELCLQINEVVSGLLKPFYWLVNGCVMGGEKKKSEKARLRKGVTILAGTPGRLLDHFQTTESFKTNAVEFLVLDEADRLLDMGFEKDVLEIISTIDKRRDGRVVYNRVRQTVLVSATLGGAVRKLASRVLRDPKMVEASGDAWGPGGAAPKAKAVNNSYKDRETPTVLKKEAVPVKTVAKPAKAIGHESDSDDSDRGYGSSDDEEEHDYLSDVSGGGDDHDQSDGESNNEDIDSDDGGGGGGGGGDDDQQGVTRMNLGDGSGSDDDADTFDMPKRLRQHYAVVPCKTRLATLSAFLRGRALLVPKTKCIVFCCSIAVVETVHELLSRAWAPTIKAPKTNDWTTAGWMEEGFKKAAEDAGGEEDSDDEDRDKHGLSGQTGFVGGGGFGGGGGRRGMAKKQEKKDGNDDEHSADPLLPVPLFKLHGSLPQTERTKIFFAFCHAPAGVLICTDVAARGLDFPFVDWIVQYDPPGEPREYVHRVGRTARMTHDGDSLLFVMPHEEPYIGTLKEKGLNLMSLEVSTIHNMLVPQDTARAIAGDIAKAKARKGMQAGPAAKMGQMVVGGVASSCLKQIQHAFEDIISTDKVMAGSSRDAFCSFVRAYATHSKGTKHIFHPKALHLGHLAASFGLRDTPSAFGRFDKKQKAKGRKRNRERNMDRERNKRGRGWDF